MAIAPGVPFVLASVRKRGGRLALAVELAVLLAAAIDRDGADDRGVGACRRSPRRSCPSRKFATDPDPLSAAAALIGIVVGGRFPTLATPLGRPLQFVFFGAPLILIALLLAPQIVARRSQPCTARCGMLAMLDARRCSRWRTGWLLGGPAARRPTRAWASGRRLRNVGLCALIATSFSRPARVAAAVLTYLVIQIIVSTLFGAIFATKSEGGDRHDAADSFEVRHLDI